MRRRVPRTVLAAALVALVWQPGRCEDRASGVQAGACADAGMVRVGSFCIDVYEYPNQMGALPRVNVSWEEAADLCRAQAKRLCSEREWQQAAAGPESHLYGYGPAFESGRCNAPYQAAGTWRRDRGTATSGAFPGCSSDCGAFDLIGNVWEWTADRYSADRDWRVVRGGSWFHNVNLARVDSRYGRHLDPTYRLDLIGFRCCRSVDNEPAAGADDE